jgi:glycosyltransferase involved in cell wall biosynthesis
MRLLMIGSASYKSSLTYFRLVTLARHLSRTGLDVSLIAPSADKYNNFIPEPNATIPGVELIQPWQPVTRNMIVNLLPYLLTASMAVLRKRRDLIYIYKPTPITIVGLMPKLLFGTPIIVDLDDLGSEVMRLEGQSGILVSLVAWCERLTLRHATAVVVASTYLEKLVRAQYPHKPILLLSNGVELDEYSMPAVSQPRPAMYYFGALNRLSLIEPFLRVLPEVLAAVPDAQVYILGGGTELDATKKLVAQLGIQDHVQFSGWIDKQAIQQYAQFADIALCVQPDIPTVRAASNLKVFQYMALGSVSVVSDVGDLASYVDAGRSDAAGMSVSAGDDAQLTKTLIYLLTHDKVRSHMATSARRRAETTYAWSTLVIKLQPFLLEHVARPKGART